MMNKGRPNLAKTGKQKLVRKQPKQLKAKLQSQQFKVKQNIPKVRAFRRP